MNKCKKNKYHNWEVTEVRGELPHQELKLVCKDCDVEYDELYFE